MNDTKIDDNQISHTNRIDFQNLAEMVTGHPACRHGMFHLVQEKAKHNSLTQEQVDVFTRSMMARIFRTIPNIAGLVQSSMLNGDSDTAKTAMQNLKEEMGDAGKTHSQLAEDAFNALREAHSLPRLTMKQAHDTVPLPESYTQEQLWVSGYRDFPAIASWLQETASGGSSANNMGMMVDLFNIFAELKDKIGIEKFREAVLPYFQAHIKIKETNGQFHAVFDNKAAEYQHGIRAKHDAMRTFSNLSPENRGVLKNMARAFLDAQSGLFDAVQRVIEPNLSSKSQPFIFKT